MKRFLITTAICMAATGPALAQSATGVGIGTGIATSHSRSDSTAIGGGVGNAGTINPTNNTTITSNVPTQTTSTLTTQGKTSVSTVPSVFAPGLAAAGIESCLGAVSGGGSWLGTGITLGGSVPDLDCATRLDARTLWSFGLKKAAVARLCQNDRIYSAMPEVCGQYIARPAPIYAPAVQPTTYAGTAAYLEERQAVKGSIMLVDGKTGKDRLCNDYDEGKKRCRQWADAAITTRITMHSDPKKGTKTAPASAGAETKTARAVELKKD